MLLFAAIMMATYVGVAVERFHKTVAALSGAVVLVALSLALGLFEYPKVYEMSGRRPEHLWRDHRHRNPGRRDRPKWAVPFPEHVDRAVRPEAERRLCS